MLVLTTFGCAVFLFFMGLTSYEAGKATDPESTPWNYMTITGCCLFLVMFQWGPGPITWMYMSEIMNNKGVAIGTLLNLFFTLLFSLFTQGLFNSL